MSASLFTLPRELVDHILSYVSKRDFRRFSRCSHTCRNFIVPLVFSRIEWRTASKAVEFRNGGMVAHLRPVVQHISMQVSGRPNELLRTIETFQVYMDVLALFPNITSLWINFTLIEEIEANFIHTIFTKLSTGPAFHTLRSLNFTCKRYKGITFHDLAGALNQDYYAALPEQLKEYLGPKIRKEDNVEPPPGPPGLTELIVVTDQFTLTPTRRAEPQISFLHQSSAKTLTRLRIRSEAMFVTVDGDNLEQEPNFRWDGLKQLQLEFGYSDQIGLPEIGDRFPDIEDLVILKKGQWIGAHRWPVDGDTAAAREALLCTALQGMKKLRRVRIPWPADRSGGGMRDRGYISTEVLEKVVNSWVKGGAEKLQKVVFAGDNHSNSQGHAWQSIDKLIGFNVVRNGSALGDEYWWKLEVETGEMLGVYIYGAEQHSMDELFNISVIASDPNWTMHMYPFRQYKPPIDLYGKENWFS